MRFEWSEEKDALLQSTRDISFTMVEDAIANGNLLDIVPHPDEKKYPHQQILYVEILGYVYCVPCVQKGEVWFLKTIYPSRKASKIFLGVDKP